ncbi:MAG: DEAD/DEAH box helicase [Kineosporiaceae bacterium]
MNGTLVPMRPDLMSPRVTTAGATDRSAPGNPSPSRGGWPDTPGFVTHRESALDPGLDEVFRPVLDPVLDAVGHAGLAAVSAIRYQAPREGIAVTWPPWTDSRVVAALGAAGVTQPWQHQAQAADHAWAGSHVVVATGPASGKSLAYQLPALTAAVVDGGTTLYLSPTTALGADQADRLRRLEVPGVGVAHLDGDSPRDERQWAKAHAHVVHLTPDLVHHALLPRHAEWGRVLRRLRLVVVDECHAYRGVFGSHVAAVLRRLLRAARLRGAEPVVVACSATAVDPGPFVARLSGIRPVVIDVDAAPHPGAALVMVRAMERRPVASAALFAGCVERGVQTAAFTASRAGAEAMARRARREIEDRGVTSDDAAAMVASYRGGHLASERRSVEAALRDGRLRGVATTSALEVGVDLSGLDAVVLDGWPGSVTSLHQRAGRAGRAGRPGTAVVVLGDDPVDAHVAVDPDRVLDRPVEAAVTDPDNPYVLAPHLAAAALESPLTEEDLALFGPTARGVVTAMEARGDLRRRPAGWFWARRAPPAAADLRAAAGGRAVTLLESGTARVLGTVDQQRACRTVHPGAVYLHRWDTYVVDELDLDDGVALLHAEDPGWTTSARQRTDLAHLEVDAWRSAGGGRLAYGTVAVTTTVTGFVRLDPAGAVLREHPLDLPGRTMTTRAVWWRTDRAAATDGGLHAAEHLLVALLPLVVPCDRSDIAGRGEARGPGAPGGTVTVWDAWPGGAGYAQRAHGRWRDWTRAAAARLAECPCAAGCPSCVVQPGCERANSRLDKAAAHDLLVSADG